MTLAQKRQVRRQRALARTYNEARRTGALSLPIHAVKLWLAGGKRYL